MHSILLPWSRRGKDCHDRVLLDRRALSDVRAAEAQGRAARPPGSRRTEQPGPPAVERHTARVFPPGLELRARPDPLATLASLEPCRCLAPPPCGIARSTRPARPDRLHLGEPGRGQPAGSTRGEKPAPSQPNAVTPARSATPLPSSLTCRISHARVWQSSTSRSYSMRCWNRANGPDDRRNDPAAGRTNYTPPGPLTPGAAAPISRPGAPGSTASRAKTSSPSSKLNCAVRYGRAPSLGPPSTTSPWYAAKTAQLCTRATSASGVRASNPAPSLQHLLEGSPSTLTGNVL